MLIGCVRFSCASCSRLAVPRRLADSSRSEHGDTAPWLQLKPVTFKLALRFNPTHNARQSRSGERTHLACCVRHPVERPYACAQRPNCSRQDAGHNTLEACAPQTASSITAAVDSHVVICEETAWIAKKYETSSVFEARISRQQLAKIVEGVLFL